MHSNMLGVQAVMEATRDVGRPSENVLRPTADRLKATATSSLRGLRKTAGDWFGVSPTAMEETRRAFLMRMTLGRSRRGKASDGSEGGSDF